MRRDHRFTIVLTALAVLPIVLALPACEDSQSAGERAAAIKIDESLAAAAKALPDGASIGTDEQALAAAAELRRIAQSLSSIQGASPGQKSAALMAAASMQRQSASIDLAIANRLEQALRMDRLAVDRAASDAASLESLAAPLERVDFASARTLLKGQRDQAEAQVRRLQSEIRALESALALVGRQIETSETEAKSLEQQSDRLRVDARAMTPRQALPLVEQAADIQRRTASVRGELGVRQSERNAIEPQLAGAKALGSGGTAIIEVTDDALRNLQALTETGRSAATQARRNASDIRGTGKSRLEGVLGSMSEGLDPRYAAAIEALDRSATLASQAATGVDAEGADSARIAQAAAQMALARALWQRSTSLDEHAALLRRLDSVGGWGEPSQLAAIIVSIDATRTEAATKSKELFTSAGETLGQLRSPSRVNGPEVAGLRAQIERAIKELERPGSSAVAAGGGAGGSGGSGGAESPEALIALFTPNAETNPAAAFDVMRSSQNAPFLEVLRSMATAMEPLRVAMISKFGSADVLDAAASTGMSAPRSARLVSQEAESAVIEVDTPQGAAKANLVKVDGRWYLDFDSFLDGMAPGQGAMMASTLPMLSAVSKVMQGVATDMSTRIGAGEFATAEEAMAAFQAEVAKAMQSAAGGMGGG